MIPGALPRRSQSSDPLRGPAATERRSVGRCRMIAWKREPLAYARGSESDQAT